MPDCACLACSRKIDRLHKAFATFGFEILVLVAGYIVLFSFYKFEDTFSGTFENTLQIVMY